MKNLVIILVLACVISGCANQQKRDEKAVKEFIISKMNDPKDYIESISFSDRDSVFVDEKIESLLAENIEKLKAGIEEQTEYLQKAGKARENYYIYQSIHYYKEYSFYKHMYESTAKENIELKKENIRLLDEYNPIYVGYEIKHKFRMNVSDKPKIVEFYVGFDLENKPIYMSLTGKDNRSMISEWENTIENIDFEIIDL